MIKEENNMINWKLRLENKYFWLTAIPAFLLVLQASAAVFGYHLDLGDIGNKLILLVNAVFVFLTAIGLVNDPTTSGITDSARALEYKKPSEE
jgi:phi LC3 family holin